jgi:hypothetical protein
MQAEWFEDVLFEGVSPPPAAERLLNHRTSIERTKLGWKNPVQRIGKVEVHSFGQSLNRLLGN